MVAREGHNMTFSSRTATVALSRSGTASYLLKRDCASLRRSLVLAKCFVVAFGLLFLVVTGMALQVILSEA